MSDYEMRHNGDKVKKALNEALGERRERMYGIAKKIIFSTFSYIIQISPVDTGRYRAAHTLEEGDPPESNKSNLEFGEGIKQPEAANTEALSVLNEAIKVAQRTGKMKVYIMNPLPYAWPLERGHSPQAPNGVYAMARKRAQKLWKKVAI